MSNLFKKVRIIHSPEERRYIIEQCRVWSWRWEQVDHFPYVDVRNSNPHSVHDLSGDAYDKAKKKAEMLLARSVVWEQSNYFIGN
jgi:hypothetical protein